MRARVLFGVMVCALCAIIVRAAFAAECKVVREGCRRVPVANGTVGETVLVCEKVRVTCE